MEHETLEQLAEAPGVTNVVLDAPFYPNPAQLLQAQAQAEELAATIREAANNDEEPRDVISELLAEDDEVVLEVNLDDPEDLTFHALVNRTDLIATHIYFAEYLGDERLMAWRMSLGEDLYWLTLEQVSSSLHWACARLDEHDGPFDREMVMLSPNLMVFLASSLTGIIDDEDDDSMDSFMGAFADLWDTFNMEEAVVAQAIADLLGKIRLEQLEHTPRRGQWKELLNDFMTLYAVSCVELEGMWNDHQERGAKATTDSELIGLINGRQYADIHRELIQLVEDRIDPPEGTVTSEMIIGEIITKLPEWLHTAVKVHWKLMVAYHHPEDFLKNYARSLWPATRLLAMAFTAETWQALCHRFDYDELISQGHTITQDYYRSGCPHVAWPEIRSHVVMIPSIRAVHGKVIDTWAEILYTEMGLLEEIPIFQHMLHMGIASGAAHHYPVHRNTLH